MPLFQQTDDGNLSENDPHKIEPSSSLTKIGLIRVLKRNRCRALNWEAATGRLLDGRPTGLSSLPESGLWWKIYESLPYPFDIFSGIVDSRPRMPVIRWVK